MVGAGDEVLVGAASSSPQPAPETGEQRQGEELGENRSDRRAHEVSLRLWILACPEASVGARTLRSKVVELSYRL